MFCPKCGSILIPKKKGSKTTLVCNSCGAVSTNVEKTKLHEKILKKDRVLKVVEKEPETLPITDTECPKCGHKKAYYWMIQTRAADEPETQFFKCEKCSHKWRHYD